MSRMSDNGISRGLFSTQGALPGLVLRAGKMASTDSGAADLRQSDRLPLLATENPPRRLISNRPSPPPRCHTQSPAQAAGPRQRPVPSRRSRQRLRVRRRDLRPARLTGLPARPPIAGRSWIRPPRGALPGGSAHSSAAIILVRRAAASASSARKPLALISANPRHRQPDHEAVLRFLLRSGHSSLCGGSHRSCRWRRPDRVIPSRRARIALLNRVVLLRLVGVVGLSGRGAGARHGCGARISQPRRRLG